MSLDALLRLEETAKSQEDSVMVSTADLRELCRSVASSMKQAMQMGESMRAMLMSAETTLNLSPQMADAFQKGQPLLWRLDDYWLAAKSMEGPLATEWRERPSMLVNDLIAALIHERYLLENKR